MSLNKNQPKLILIIAVLYQLLLCVYILSHFRIIPTDTHFPEMMRKAIHVSQLRIIVDALLLLAGVVGLSFRKTWSWFLLGILTIQYIWGPLIEFYAALSVLHRFSVTDLVNSLLFVANILLLFSLFKFGLMKAPQRDLILLLIIIILGLAKGYYFPQLLALFY